MTTYNGNTKRVVTILLAEVSFAVHFIHAFFPPLLPRAQRIELILLREHFTSPFLNMVVRQRC